MHRARLQSVIALVVLAVLGVARDAAAFHVGSLFSDPPGKGGGGGIYYTGAPADKGWDCAACHIGAERRVKVLLSTMPQSLLTSLSYTPGQAYTMTLSLGGESKGQSSARSNYNGFVLSIFDKSGKPAGKISGFAPEEIYAAANTTIGSAGLKVNTSSWTFTWTAPAAGTGEVTLYVAMVDGNGADSPPNVTLTDPFGDDVATGKLVFRDPTTAQRTNPPAASALAACAPAEKPTPFAAPLAWPVAMPLRASDSYSIPLRLARPTYAGPSHGPFSGGPYESALGLFLANALQAHPLRSPAAGRRYGRLSGRCHPA